MAEPIATAPRDGTWILGIGDSGVTRTPYRYHATRWVEYDVGEAGHWETEQGCWFTDDGEEPTHWCPLVPMLVPR